MFTTRECNTYKKKHCTLTQPTILPERARHLNVQQVSQTYFKAYIRVCGCLPPPYPAFSSGFLLSFLSGLFPRSLCSLSFFFSPSLVCVSFLFFPKGWARDEEVTRRLESWITALPTLPDFVLRQFTGNFPLNSYLNVCHN